MSITTAVQKTVLEITELAMNAPEELHVFFESNGAVKNFTLKVRSSDSEYSESVTMEEYKKKELFSECIYLDDRHGVDSLVGIERLKNELLKIYAEVSA